MVKLLCNVPEKMVRTTFSEILHGVLAEAADKNFLTFPKEQENKTYTYRAFAERLTFLNSLYPVQQLKGRQIVILDTRREYVVFWLCAAMAYGAVAVPMNGAQPKNELGELIATLEPLAIVVPEGELQEWKSVLPENAADRLVASEEVERAELSGEIPPVGLASPEDTAVIIFTSGTTGGQKGAMIDHANLFGNMIPTADCYKYVYAPIKIYSILPYYHVFGITIDLLIVLMSGSELYLGKISNHLPAEIKKNGPSKKLMGFILNEKDKVAVGGEHIFANDEVVGKITAATFSPILDESLGLAYVNIAHAVPGTEISVVVDGQSISGKLCAKAMYDPECKRLKA